MEENPEGARVERGHITEVPHFALGMAALLERQGFTVAAAELRRLHAENEALRKTLAASCDEERQQMWETGPGGGCSRALSAEFQRNALLKALRLIQIECQHLHHAKKDQHALGQPCPVVARINAAIAQAED